MCFHVKFAKFLRTPILKNICERLLLSIISSTNSPDVSYCIIIEQYGNQILNLFRVNVHILYPLFRAYKMETLSVGQFARQLGTSILNYPKSQFQLHRSIKTVCTRNNKNPLIKASLFFSSKFYLPMYLLLITNTVPNLRQPFICNIFVPYKYLKLKG